MLPEPTMLPQLQSADLVLLADLLRRDSLVLLVAGLHPLQDRVDRTAERLPQTVDRRRDVRPGRSGLELLKDRPMGPAGEVVRIGPGLHHTGPQEDRKSTRLNSSHS